MSIFGQWEEQAETTDLVTNDGLVNGVYTLELLTLDSQTSKNSGNKNLVATYKIVNHEQFQGQQVKQWHSMEPRKNRETGQIITNAPPMFVVFLKNLLGFFDLKPKDVAHIQGEDFQSIVQFIANKSDKFFFPYKSIRDIMT